MPNLATDLARVMERNEELERISDKIRSGEPVGLDEAIAAIQYQEGKRRRTTQGNWWKRLLRKLTGKPKAAETFKETPNG